MSERLNWIKKIYSDYSEFTYEEWMNSKVVRMFDVPLFQFYNFHSRYDDFINPKDIIGIDYAYDYNYSGDTTWLDLLNQLKRLDHVIRNFQSYEEVINHIHKNEDTKTVLKYGNHLITTSGQHRLCLAKFLNLNSVKVSITEYKFDDQRYQRYNILKNNQAFLKGLTSFSDEAILEESKNEFKFLFFGYECIKIKTELIGEFRDYYQYIKFDDFNFYTSQISSFLTLESLQKGCTIEINSTQDFKKCRNMIIHRKRRSYSVS